MNNLQRLHAEHDQSPWIDFIDRDLLTSGRLADLVADGIRGLTSNPTIFAKAVSSGQYDELIRREIESGDGSMEIYEEIAVSDVSDAADVLRPVYDEADGTDGFVSIEVEPNLANDTEGTLKRTRHLWSRVHRPNAFVKIPATPAGLPAITAAIAEGINVNITLMFSVDVYRDVARAYIAGLRQRLERGEDVSRVASVASFFVSRVDTKVDKRLEEIGGDEALALRGKAAVANAKMAYAAYNEIFGGDEWADLKAAGARVQRCLWASTSTKNPAYRDVLYVEELIGPDTVNTMPESTLLAFQDHGTVAPTLERGLDEAHRLLEQLKAVGVDYDDVVATLEDEGVRKFSASFDELRAGIESQRKALAPA